MQNEGSAGSTPSASSPAAGAGPHSSPLDELAADRAANAKSVGTVYGDGLPIVRWSDGELPRMVDEAEEALIASDVDIYQRGPVLVRVVRRQAMSVRNFKRPAGALGLTMVDKPYLVEAMTRSAHWERYDKRQETHRPINAPEIVASTYLSRSGHWKVPPLLACISAPTLRPDGSLLQLEGYDRDTATYYDPCGVSFPRIPEQPTREDAEAALAELREVFAEFPFVSAVDEAVFLSLLLCALVRRSLPAAPLGALSARVPESGKTALANCISLIASGVTPTIMRYPREDEEAAKAALAVLSEGEAIVLIDNVERALQGDWLCVILTSEKYSGRVLGLSKMMEVPTSTLWLATGNNIVIQGDLRTRTLLCLIDPRMERPRERKFKRNLEEWIPPNRTRLVAAGLTIMRAFVASGIDPRELVPPWSRFEAWSRMVRAPLVWLNCADPCESMDALEESDPKREQLLVLLNGWKRKFGDSSHTAAEVISDYLNTPPDLVAPEWREVLTDIAGDRDKTLRPKKLSRYVRDNAGHIVDGMHFESDGQTAEKVGLWKVVKASV